MRNKIVIIYGIFILLLMGYFTYTITHGIAYYDDKAIEGDASNNNNSNGIYRSYNNGFHHK